MNRSTLPKNHTIEIMDTTLRDGEQTHNVSFAPTEKLHIATLLLEKLNINRIEVGSARVSDGEAQAVTRIINWTKSKDKFNRVNKIVTDGKFIDRVEILGFVDYNKSADWLKACGGKVINLLTKGSYNHLTKQLKKTSETHFADIEKTVNYSAQQKIQSNVYLEDWSNGYKDSRNYVYEMIEALSNMKINRFMLPDTLGVMYPTQVSDAISDLCQRFPKLHFDFHPHNDYGLATINVLEAIKAGAKGIHATINCLGERTGNASLAEVVANLRDQLKIKTQVNEKNLYPVSKVVETFSGKRIADNTPITGEDVFTQTAGIHADGDKKGNLYASALIPGRFGRKRSYALGKLAGKASIEQNLLELGIDLDEQERKLVLSRVIALGDQKKTVSLEDLPFIIADVLKKNVAKKIELTDVVVTSGLGISPICSLSLLYKERKYKSTGKGDGGYDAFMDALRHWANKMKLNLPKLINYEVRIPPGGKTSALVECKITWDTKFGKAQISEGVNSGIKNLTTRGVDSDQVIAAINATEKMLNLI